MTLCFGRTRAREGGRGTHPELRRDPSTATAIEGTGEGGSSKGREIRERYITSTTLLELAVLSLPSQTIPNHTLHNTLSNPHYTPMQGLFNKVQEKAAASGLMNRPDQTGVDSHHTGTTGTTSSTAAGTSPTTGKPGLSAQLGQLRSVHTSYLFHSILPGPVTDSRQSGADHSQNPQIAQLNHQLRTLQHHYATGSTGPALKGLQIGITAHKVRLVVFSSLVPARSKHSSLASITDSPPPLHFGMRNREWRWTMRLCPGIPPCWAKRWILGCLPCPLGMELGCRGM